LHQAQTCGRCNICKAASGSLLLVPERGPAGGQVQGRAFAIKFSQGHRRVQLSVPEVVRLGKEKSWAAITGRADAMATWNEKDFPREVLDPFGIEVQTPDEFVLNQLMLEKLTALAALKRMRERWVRPQYDAIALVALLEKRGLPQTAAHLRDVVALL